MTETSTYPLRLPKSLKEQVVKLAKRDGTSINQFIAMAVAEKISAMATEQFKALTVERQKARVRQLGKELAPAFAIKGIGRSPEGYIWTRLISQRGEIPDTSTTPELEGR